MLGFGRFGWRTVVGGSRTYVDRIADRLGERLRVGLGVRSIARHSDDVIVLADDGTTRQYDKVVVATHGDQALRLLADPSLAEQRVLGAFTYTQNETVLHTDASLLPRTHLARAAWNFHSRDCDTPEGKPTITYSLNRLQRIEADEEYCVTLNRPDTIDPGRVIARMTYEHPLYTLESIDAQPPCGRSPARATRTSRAPTATAFTRMASRQGSGWRRHSGWSGEVGPLRGDAHARAARAGAERLQVPGALPARRPRRAARAGRRLRLVSWNAPNVVSFRDADHLEDDGLPIKAKVLRFVREHGVAT